MAQTTRLPPTIMIDVLLHYPAALLELDVTVTNSKIPDTTFNMYQAWLKTKMTERCDAMIEANNAVGFVYVTHDQ